MSNYQITIKEKNGNEYKTLRDILPESGPIDILFIGKVPAEISVEKGHYFQGNQGTAFWNMLGKYYILKKGQYQYYDEALVENNYGITDIVKKPRNYGNEPGDTEYIEGKKRIMELIEQYSPRIIVFAYKPPFEALIPRYEKVDYGFNPHCDKYFGGAKTFLFPMSGTPCNREKQFKVMCELCETLHKIRGLE